jgi:FtsZ-binding cell division protein ZapB
VSLAYDGERADSRALEQLETVIRHVAEELAAWHARALKTEAELKEHGATLRSSPRLEPEARTKLADLEQENKQLRTRLDAARTHVGELLGRLTFLEDQAREQANGTASRSSGAA